MTKKAYTHLFCDLDGTLIETISHSKFPKGIWDMKFRFDTLDAIRNMSPTYLFIVTNQGGIELGEVNQQNFKSKIEYIEHSIQEYCDIKDENIGYLYCTTNDDSNQFRKPNPGMIQQILSKFHISKNDCLMIGDSSTKTQSKTDTDKKAAINSGISYMDVDEFIKSYKE